MIVGCMPRAQQPGGSIPHVQVRSTCEPGTTGTPPVDRPQMVFHDGFHASAPLSHSAPGQTSVVSHPVLHLFEVGVSGDPAFIFARAYNRNRGRVGDAGLARTSRRGAQMLEIEEWEWAQEVQREEGAELLGFSVHTLASRRTARVQAPSQSPPSVGGDDTTFNIGLHVERLPSGIFPIRLSKPSTFQQSPVTGQNTSTSSPGVMDLLQGSLTRYIINATNPIYLRPARYRPTVASTPAPTPSSQLYMLAYTHLPIHPHLSSLIVL
ncbi:hypothetical protein O988_07390 [Pseudogymnoascus sp. VKM F-3808]|nr:hypothetical protein O988_07390 [Pseudogymnoascus sp. VKM F-3808]